MKLWITQLVKLYCLRSRLPRWGWMSCEGQVLTITQNQALFSLIGANYGGDGRTTFALPNLNGASPLPQMKYYIATEGIYPQRQ